MKGTALLAVLILSACGKSASDGPSAGAGTSATASAGAGPSASAGAGPSASAGASPSGRASEGVVGWRGGYKSVATDITLPKDVKWRVPETSDGVGEGTMTLTVDPSSGRVQGTVDGVLGPARVDGFAADGRLTGTLMRQDPRDHGFIGTLTGNVTDAGAHGTMNAALAEASAVRSATFDLTPVRAAAAGP